MNVIFWPRSLPLAGPSKACIMICPSAYEIRKSTSAHAVLPSKLCYQTPSTRPRRQGMAGQVRSGKASIKQARTHLNVCSNAMSTSPAHASAIAKPWFSIRRNVTTTKWRCSHMASQIGSAWQGPSKGEAMGGGEERCQTTMESMTYLHRNWLEIQRSQLPTAIAITIKVGLPSNFLRRQRFDWDYL